MRTLFFKRMIGKGSVGMVYEAHLQGARAFVRKCAVKVMHHQSPDYAHFRGRMRDEARLLGILQDDQVLGVTELVRVEGRDCVIMEFVEGIDLAELMQSETIPARALAELGAEVAGTLYRAHTATDPSTGQPLQVIHRDIKPHNVMVTGRGGVRLLDFGVARAVFKARESHTQGLVLGTMNYFAPEIMAGAEPTPAIDIYGLGVTLWEAASGTLWGEPEAYLKRFERRIDSQLNSLSGDYAPLVPVLRQIFQWDPKSRPSGREVETALLEAAGSLPGEGLRTWARAKVPPILVRQASSGISNEWVGKTFPIEEEEGAPLASTDSPSAINPEHFASLGSGSGGAPAKKRPRVYMDSRTMAMPLPIKRPKPPKQTKKKTNLFFWLVFALIMSIMACGTCASFSMILWLVMN